MRLPAAASSQLRALTMLSPSASATPPPPPTAAPAPASPGPRPTSAFRLVEKRYKSRAGPPAAGLTHTQVRKLRQAGGPSASWRPPLADVWDPRALLDGDVELANGPWSLAQRDDVVCFAADKGSKRAWAVRDIPGLVVLPAFFSPDEQKELVASCLVDYTQPPNRTNLDQHFILPQPPSTLWSLYSDAVSRAPADNDQDAPAETVLQPRHATLTAEDALKYARMPDGRQLVQNTPGEELTPADVALTGAHLPEPSRSARTTPVTKLLKELRWTNIGLYYDWSSKNYNFGQRIPFPADLGARLAKVVRDDVDWARVYRDLPADVRAAVGFDKWAADYELDAGIINFYQTNDSLMGHVDRSELDPHRPLVSVSLGLSAIFLLGGTTRDEPPLPILLRSGDVVVLSGPSRRAYHGIPRVLDGTLPAHFTSDPPPTGSAWDPALAEYLQTTRLNVNARSVFPPGFDMASLLR